jgi:hypothetical protein
MAQLQARVGEEDVSAKSATIARLKAQLAAAATAPRQYLLTLSTGVSALDALGLFRLGAVVEVTGQAAGGKTSVGLGLVASACRAKRLAAWVDGPREWYPPAAAAVAGLDLQRVLLVRPPTQGQLVWAAVQLLRSGAFACVVLDVSATQVKVGMTEAKKLLDAARTGGALLVLLTTEGLSATGLMRVSLTTPQTRHLNVVPTVQQVSSEEEVVLTVQKSSSTFNAHRQVQWRRSLGGPFLRASRLAHEGLALPSVRGGAGLTRVKKNELRDGYGGLRQQHGCWGGSGRAPRVTAAQQAVASTRERR